MLNPHLNSQSPRWLFLVAHRGLAHYQSQSQKADAAAIVISDCNNPYLNLAMEQHLFKSAPLKNSHTLMIWRNNPTVVIGRNQNPWAECDLKVNGALILNTC
jgi:lipoate-protein ligase A